MHCRCNFHLGEGTGEKARHSWYGCHDAQCVAGKPALSTKDAREHSRCPCSLCFAIYKSLDFVVYKHLWLWHCLSWAWYENAWRSNNYFGKPSRSSHPSSAVGKCTAALSTWKAKLSSGQYCSKQGSGSQKSADLQYPAASPWIKSRQERGVNCLCSQVVATFLI